MGKIDKVKRMEKVRKGKKKVEEEEKGATCGKQC